MLHRVEKVRESSCCFSCAQLIHENQIIIFDLAWGKRGDT